MAQHPPKTCFGKSWDPNNTACSGGNDPAYLHPERGTNKRDPCIWFNACATRVTAAKQPQQQQLIPAQQLVRQQQQQPTPQMPQMPATQPTSPWGPIGPAVGALVNRYMPQGIASTAPYQTPVHPQQQQQMYHQHLYQQPQPMMAPQMVHPSMALTPYAVPMNYQAPGAQMSGYLTIPEPVVPGQHWGARLFLNVARSMAKASGHTVANFFAHTPISPWPVPPTVPNQ